MFQVIVDSHHNYWIDWSEKGDGVPHPKMFWFMFTSIMWIVLMGGVITFFVTGPTKTTEAETPANLLQDVQLQQVGERLLQHMQLHQVGERFQRKMQASKTRINGAIEGMLRVSDGLRARLLDGGSLDEVSTSLARGNSVVVENMEFIEATSKQIEVAFANATDRGEKTAEGLAKRFAPFFPGAERTPRPEVSKFWKSIQKDVQVQDKRAPNTVSFLQADSFVENLVDDVVRETNRRTEDWERALKSTAK
mmetsp:Transcript_48087/g.108212  ORF Transcript_48087/g.108212 Transcript_48087/m.108212 type:complete len:250 (-) Transcript_48087:31-780(-)